MSTADDASAMAFGWTILHVPNVAETVAFYEQAFGLKRRFVDPNGEYAELATGGTTLAFAAHSLVDRLGTHAEPAASASPHGVEIALATSEAAIEATYRHAVDAGCVPVKPLTRMPWGQTVGFVRDRNGFLVEICTPAAAG